MSPSALLAVVGLACPIVLGAQSVLPGQRIRVSRACTVGEFCVPADGRFVAWSAAGITLTQDGAKQELPLATGITVEVFRGSRGHALTGLLLGSVAGGVAGALAAGNCADEPGETPLAGLCGANFVGGLGLGALAGLLIGALIKTERWDRVTPPPVALQAVPGGVGVRIALRVSP